MREREKEREQERRDRGRERKPEREREGKKINPFITKLCDASFSLHFASLEIKTS